jgi:signal transduction histidine kinase
MEAPASRLVRSAFRPLASLGFAARLAIATSALVGTACVAQAWLVSSHAVGSVRAQLVTSGRRLATAVAGQARVAMEAGDVVALREIAERMAAQHDVVSCRFFDRSGLVLAASGPAAGGGATGGGASPVEVGPDRWVFSSPVDGLEPGAPPIGTVEIGVATDALLQLRRRIATAAAGLAALVILAAVVASIVLARAITGPLAALARATDAIRAGDLDATVAVARRDEIGRLAASFNEMVESLARHRITLVDKVQELERVNRLKSEFVATVSHELRTPLNVILGYLEMLREDVGGPLTPGQRELVANVERYSILQLDMITDVLDFSRLASGKVTCRVERFALRPLLEDLLALHATRATERGLALALDASADLPALDTDRTKLEEILRNLVGNAIKFTSAGGVTVRATPGPEAERVRIDVTDTGRGIAAADVAHVFEPFYQAGSSSTRTTGGVGLGLSIVHQLVTVLGGSASIESTLGRGTTVRVEIPVRLATGEDDGAAELALDATARNARTVRVPERALGRARRSARAR